MSDIANTVDKPLEQAEAQLRDIFQRRAPHAPVEAGSLGRMLNHIVNIRRSVTQSSEDHANAAKRLGDFSATLSRMAKQVPESSAEDASRMLDLSQTLSSASRELTNAQAAAKQASSAS